MYFDSFMFNDNLFTFSQRVILLNPELRISVTFSMVSPLTKKVLSSANSKGIRSGLIFARSED